MSKLKCSKYLALETTLIALLLVHNNPRYIRQPNAKGQNRVIKCKIGLPQYPIEEKPQKFDSNTTHRKICQQTKSNLSSFGLILS